MATREADIRGRGRPGSSDTLRIRPYHEIQHFGVDRRRRQNFVWPLGLLCLERTHHGFHLEGGPSFDGSLFKHSILLSLSVSFLFLGLDYSHTALHCPTVLFLRYQESRDGQRLEDSIVFLKRRWQTHIPHMHTYNFGIPLREIKWSLNFGTTWLDVIYLKLIIHSSDYCDRGGQYAPCKLMMSFHMSF